MVDGPINLFDFESAAEKRMAKAEWDYVAGGATDEVTLRRTRLAYDNIAIRPRMLAGIKGDVDISLNVLGQRISAPFMLAPAGGHKRAHPDGELASARAAAKFGTVLGVSANANYTIEEIGEAADGPKWFQCYFYRNRETTVEMVRRAEDAGYNAICITLDAVWPAKRERNIRNGYRQGARPNNASVPRAETNAKFDSGQSSRGLVDPGATWEDLAWLRTVTDLPLVFKGIITGEDAALAREHGVDGLIVSNHGGRNLDTTLTTIEALPEVADAVGGKLQVFLDGGIRRGNDVIKALALGADAVLFGRPLFWGLAYDGEGGLRQVLDILRDEMISSMVMGGRKDLASIDASFVRQMPDLTPMRP
jgi:4-hydroxymandelate oxidase